MELRVRNRPSPLSETNGSGQESHAREDLRSLLLSILRTLTRLPWLATDAGGVFLAHPEDQRLELVAHINFSPYIQGACNQVAYGHCLCGRVAESGQLLHAGCVDHRHETRYEGMGDHGHYVVPIRDETGLLGVYTLYVASGHTFRQEEADVLEDFAATMATVIRMHRMRQEKALADLIIENSQHGVVITDHNNRILWCNPTFETVTGYTLEEVKGKPPSILASGRHGPDFYRRMWHDIQTRGQWQGEIWNRRKNGEIYPEFLNIMALYDEEGTIVRYAGLFVDLTEIHQAQEHVRRLAYFDRLTELPNLTRFVELLETKLNEAQGHPRAVMMLDLDHFHEINNALGRRMGDTMLIEVARRLQERLPDCLLARAEADRFLISGGPFAMNPSRSEEAIDRLISRVQEALQHDISLMGHQVSLRSTLGLYMSQDGDSPEICIERASLALTEAKRTRRGEALVFDETLRRRAEHASYITLNIAHAVERRQLYLVYQPQIDQAGELVGAEALLRWQTPEYGSISPDVFIPHAERRGEISRIGHWAFEQAVEQFSRWKTMHCWRNRSFKLSVNLSPAQLIGHDVTESFIEICNRLDVSPGSLVLEVTETAVMQAADVIRRRLKGLAAAGFRIAIDDFGTGHSSLSRLHEFPIDTFKIDRSFVARIESGGKHLAIVRTMIHMAHELGHSVVAEGVENDRQFAILRNLGCDHFQGYWFSRPIPADELANLAMQQDI